ncbi:MAG: 5-oxoprolinase subunit PxpB [Chitinophagaceae bacterium]|nr:5-oxoprolinase subunit PxpB [Chitinophagaceae bacterium]
MFRNMELLPPFRIVPLGDSAILVDFGNFINPEVNNRILQILNAWLKEPEYYITGFTPAYSSLAIHFNSFEIKKREKLRQDVMSWVISRTEQKILRVPFHSLPEGRLHAVPACYDDEYAADMDIVCRHTGLDKEEIIRLHTETMYRVYMLGFLPGFPYLGLTNEKLYMPRKKKPELTEAGSIGIAGRQTGIYPFLSPGGWHIIGKTPLKIFDDKKENPPLFAPGDRVQFIAVTKKEFIELAKHDK